MNRYQMIAPEVIELRKNNMTWNAIAAKLGASLETVHRAIDPTYGSVRRGSANATRKSRRKASPNARSAHIAEAKPSAEDAARALAAIPPDTRDFTARLFGDPLPGRSALDQRGAA